MVSESATASLTAKRKRLQALLLSGSAILSLAIVQSQTHAAESPQAEPPSEDEPLELGTLTVGGAPAFGDTPPEPCGPEGRVSGLRHQDTALDPRDAAIDHGHHPRLHRGPPGPRREHRARAGGGRHLGPLRTGRAVRRPRPVGWRELQYARTGSESEPRHPHRRVRGVFERVRYGEPTNVSRR